MRAGAAIAVDKTTALQKTNAACATAAPENIEQVCFLQLASIEKETGEKKYVFLYTWSVARGSRIGRMNIKFMH